MIHIFYHKRDLDGYCSGAIARYYYQEVLHQKIKMYPFDYGDNFPFDQIEEGSSILMVDVTVNPYEKLLEINERYELFIIDHHKSFVDWVADKELEGIFEIGQAGCELSWQYFFYDQEMPRLVRLLGRYDVWDQSDKALWENQIMPIQMGMKLEGGNPETDFNFWKNYFGERALATETDIRIAQAGSIIMRYQEKEDAKTVSLFSFDAEFEGMKTVCLNATRFNSQVYKSVWDNTKYDIMLAWVNVKGKHCSVSLYTDKDGIDVSAIAKKYGGGGHLQAAGFQCKNVKIDNGIIIIEV